MKKNYLFLFIFLIITLLFLNNKTFAGHVCNYSPCSGGAAISCNEITGIFTYNRGSCNAGLACYSTIGNRCRNPNCPGITNCTCSNFNIEGYKQPNKTPFSNQAVFLDGGNQTTSQPYLFSNISRSSIHRLSVSVPQGSNVSYTFCYDNQTCHTTITPTPGSQVYICHNKLNSYVSLWWHFTPLIANCSITQGLSTILLGDQNFEYKVNFTDYNSNFTNGDFYLKKNWNRIGLPPPPESYYFCPGMKIGSTNQKGENTFRWTPDSTGNYILYCKANSSQASCIGYQACVGDPPEYLCDGPNSYKSVNVINPDPWYKLKDGSLYKIGSHRINVSENIKKFSDSDLDDEEKRYVIISSANSNSGIILTGEEYKPGPEYNPITSNEKNWFFQNYGSFKVSLIENYVEYAKSRKEIKIINNFNEIEKNMINLIEDNQEINQEINNNAPFVLIINGDLTINKDNFNENNLSLAIIAKKIIFSPNVKQVTGIFIAQEIEYGESDRTLNGLKVIGNLISKNQINIKNRYNEERRLDNFRPSLFIVFKPKMYLDLLPILSVINYDWTQIQ